MQDRTRHKDMDQLVLLLIAILLLFGGGCGNENASPVVYLHEHDFARDPAIVATPANIVIINLEHPGAVSLQEDDSYIPGVDRIPLTFPAASMNHEFVLEHREELDEYFMVLLDEAGHEILRVEGGNPLATEDISPGSYTLEVHHGGGPAADYTLFVRPGPQFTGTYFSGNCPDCDLRYAELSQANLSGADLAGVNLTGAVLPHANLSGVNFRRANLSGADLHHADLSGAVFPAAYLGGANLNGADISGANLGGVNLSNAVWINGELCKIHSVGECLQ